MTKKSHQKFWEIDGNFLGENRHFSGTPEKRLFAALRKGHVAAPLLKRCFSDTAGWFHYYGSRCLQGFRLQLSYDVLRFIHSQLRISSLHSIYTQIKVLE